MDSKSDLILGVLGTHWERTRKPGVEVYLESINRSGFPGRKVVLSWDLHPETRVALFRYGFEVIDLPVPAETFFHARVRVAYEYLRDHYKEFRWVHWLDLKDLILQSDPSVWIDSNAGNHSIIGSTESVSIRHEETNWLWANSILGADKANEIADCEVFNGGSFSSKAEVLHEVFKQVHPLCQAYTGGHPPCQISMAYVVNTMFKGELYTPRLNEGYVCCLHPFWSPWRVPCRPFLRDIPPVFNVNTAVLYPGTVPNPRNRSILFNDRWGNERMFEMTPTGMGSVLGIECVDAPQNKPFCIVHGYDRDWDLKGFFEFKYSQPGMDFSLERFKLDRGNKVSGNRGAGKRLRRQSVQDTDCSRHVPQTPRVFTRHT